MQLFLRAIAAYLFVGLLYASTAVTIAFQQGYARPDFRSNAFLTLRYMLTWPQRIWGLLCSPGKVDFAFGLVWSCLVVVLITVFVGTQCGSAATAS